MDFNGLIEFGYSTVRKRFIPEFKFIQKRKESTMVLNF
jgi:hypothetical protein